MGMIINWAMYTGAIVLVAELLPGFKVKSLKGAILVAAILGVLKVAIGWLLFAVIGLGTLGLGFMFSFATNWLVLALLLVLTDALSDNLTIKNFGTAFVGAVLIASSVGLLEYVIR